MPLDPTRLLSKATLGRKPPAIRSLLAHESEPDMISFLAGKPNPDGFPFEALTLRLKPDAVMATDPKTSEPIELKIEGKVLESALQYSATAGEEILHDGLLPIISTVHGRTKNDGTPAGEYGIAIGTGSQDLLSKTSLALFDAGDTLLVESPMYPGLLPDLGTRKVNTVNVDTDSEGLSATALERTLSNWSTNPDTANLKFPKAVYTVPTGGNPSGTTASKERKLAILALARKYELLILEDDPYYYLSFEGLDQDPVTRERLPSYFALERESGNDADYGYVLRFESFSKILSAGMRLGFAVGPPWAIQALLAYTATSNIHSSSPIQAVAGALLHHWGTDGFLQHVDKVAAMYLRRRQEFGEHLRIILGDGTPGQAPLGRWVTPVAGMFYWIKLHLPPSGMAPEGDSFEVISDKALKEKVLAVPGDSFYAGGRVTPYMRVSFSVIDMDKVPEGLRRLRKAVEAAWTDAGFDKVPAWTS